MKGDPMKKMSEQALKGMSEPELRSSARRLESTVAKMRKNRQNTKVLETEICYIQREIELRKKFGHIRASVEDIENVNPLEFEQS